MTELAVPAARTASPAAALEASFREIARTRMAGVPILNERLHVEAVGFQRWEGRWLGVLITPWFMSLMLLPDEPAAWHAVPLRGTASYRFPSGVYDFLGAFEAGLGEFQSCSLFSPMNEFADQDGARATATAVLTALFDTAAHVPAEPPLQIEPSIAQDAPRSVSKRDFLRGRWAPPAG